jgi:hypothetical protein
MGLLNNDNKNNDLAELAHALERARNNTARTSKLLNSKPDSKQDYIILKGDIVAETDHSSHEGKVIIKE